MILSQDCKPELILWKRTKQFFTSPHWWQLYGLFFIPLTTITPHPKDNIIGMTEFDSFCARSNVGWMRIALLELELDTAMKGLISWLSIRDLSLLYAIIVLTSITTLALIIRTVPTSPEFLNHSVTFKFTHYFSRELDFGRSLMALNRLALSHPLSGLIHWPRKLVTK